MRRLYLQEMADDFRFDDLPVNWDAFGIPPAEPLKLAGLPGIAGDYIAKLSFNLGRRMAWTPI